MGERRVVEGRGGIVEGRSEKGEGGGDEGWGFSVGEEGEEAVGEGTNDASVFDSHRFSKK